MTKHFEDDMMHETTRWRGVHACVGLAALFCGAMTLGTGCGFGRYDDQATPAEMAANNGVMDNGQWWPWACGNGSYPSAATTPVNYTVAGTCGAGGPLALSVSGCDMQGDWTVLGLSDVTTTISTSIPTAGGWEVAGTASSDASWTCDASSPNATGVLTVQCNAGDPNTPTCTSTLTPVNS